MPFTTTPWKKLLVDWIAVTLAVVIGTDLLFTILNGLPPHA